MAFNGKEGGAITLATGSAMTAEYRRQNSGQTKGHFFGRDILEALLAQDDCMGIRIYYGLDPDGVKELVLVGANSNEDDILDLVADLSRPCPNHCGVGNPLNS